MRGFAVCLLIPLAVFGLAGCAGNEPERAEIVPDPASPIENSAEPAALPERVVFAVRHAEKTGEVENPALSAAGQARAAALANLLRDAGIEAIYSSDYRRTLDTAAPLAAQHSADVTIYDPARLEDLAARIGRHGGRILVVGHSNTTPELVGLLGGEPGPPIDEEAEYDRLYVVTVGADGSVSTVLLRY